MLKPIVVLWHIGWGNKYSHHMSLISSKHLLDNTDCTGPLPKLVPTNSFQTSRITYDEIWIKNKLFGSQKMHVKSKTQYFQYNIFGEFSSKAWNEGTAPIICLLPR